MSPLYNAARIIVFIVSIFIAAFMIIPLTVFFAEISSNPRVLSIKVVGASGSGGNITLTITLSYNGSIPLYDVIIYLENYTINYGDLMPGQVLSKNITVPRNVADRIIRCKNYGMEFVIAGIYWMRVRINIGGG